MANRETGWRVVPAATGSFPAARVRETMIIPVTPRGRSRATTWLGMYDTKERWLDWALARAGIPTRHQIFGEQ